MPFSEVYRKEAKVDDKTTKQGAGRGYCNPPQRNTDLRRPHASSSQKTTGPALSTAMIDHAIKSDKQEIKNFTLRPQADEFIPRCNSSQSTLNPVHQRYPAKRSVQNRLNIARETPSNVYIPPSMENNTLEDALQQCNIQESEAGYYNGYKDYKDNLSDSKEEKGKQNEDEEICNYETYQRLIDIINILILNPAEFTNLIPSFINKLRRDGNIHRLHMVVITIIEWSIAESNFRYNGARICKYFDNTSEDSKEPFRKLLYLQCELGTVLYEPEWRNQREDDRDERRCNGLILFLAELVAQMDEPYAFTLGELLVQFITRVLKRPASSSVKYICQALKLAGHVLEKDKSRSKDMENMMRALTELVNNRQVDTHVGNMVNSVHELRKDWGRNVSNSDSSGMSNALMNEVQPIQPGVSNYNSPRVDAVPLEKVQQSLNFPIMYGPDGEILSVEESKFLQDHLIRSDMDDQIFEEISDENFDDEIATAYEEFLRDEFK